MFTLKYTLEQGQGDMKLPGLGGLTPRDLAYKASDIPSQGDCHPEYAKELADAAIDAK